ncbi:MAG: LptA/OstA family protein [Leptolyngbyaceae cyanobacterium]
MANGVATLRRDTRNFSRRGRSLLGLVLTGTLGMLLAIVLRPSHIALAQAGGQGTITLKADVQEANAITGVVTARGNVQIEYPVRDIFATSAQAQYFSEESRMILSGNVVVLQEGNRLEAETVTYLIDEGRFIALPQPNGQVETTYLVTDDTATEEGTEEETDETDNGAFNNSAPDPALSISPIN